ncbi:MAG: serine hydrolase [Cyclobacteriaceae bacterium]
MDFPHCRALILLIASVSLMVACSNPSSTDVEQSNVYWNTSTPEAEGIDPDTLNAIHQDITNGSYGLIDHFLVIRNGKMVFDQYYEQDYALKAQQYDTTDFQYNYDHPAWHPFYNGTQLHSLQSVTKSVTSMLVGIAVDEGLITSLDSSIAPYFADYDIDWSDERKSEITLGDLLTMRSGIAWDEENYDESSNDCTVMELSDDWISYVLNKHMDTIPGTNFEYNSGASVLIGKIVGVATGKRIDQWAEEKLFGPLAITDFYWKKTPKGEIDTEGGLYLSSYDLAKIGYLMLNEGQWDGQQIVSKTWVAASTSPLVTVNEWVAYGYQWWVPGHKDGQSEVFAGNGYGGQFVMVAPAYDLLVVFNGWNIHDSPEKYSYRALQKRILPNTTL